MSGKPLDQLGKLQRAVVEIVWELGEATVHQVRDRLGRAKPPAYTTILSAMQKLEKAGWLRHRADGRAYVYGPARSRAQAGAHSLRRLIDRAFRGDRLLLFQRLLDEHDLSDEELAALKKMIRQREKESRDA